MQIQDCPARRKSASARLESLPKRCAWHACIIVNRICTCGRLNHECCPILWTCCRRRRGAGIRVEELADMLRLAFSTAEPAAPSRRAAMLGYRVHIHKERLAKGASLRHRAST